jgi:hypothetical protein
MDRRETLLPNELQNPLLRDAAQPFGSLRRVYAFFPIDLDFFCHKQ